MGFLQQPQRGARKSGRVDCFSSLPRLLRKPLIAPFSSFPRRRESSPDQTWRIDSRLRGNDGDGVSATASASQVGHCERSKNRIVHGQIERRSMLRRNGWQAKRDCTADIHLGSGAVGVDPGRIGARTGHFESWPAAPRSTAAQAGWNAGRVPAAGRCDLSGRPHGCAWCWPCAPVRISTTVPLDESAERSSRSGDHGIIIRADRLYSRVPSPPFGADTDT